MTVEPLDNLLDRLTRGDDAAVEQVFRDFEPLLRMVVRRQMSAGMRAKFDSIDVVQSIWVHLLQGFRKAGWQFTSAAHFRAFLVQLTRNRFVDRLRRQRPALTMEQPLVADSSSVAMTARDPDPSDVLEAKEMWLRLLELCPSAHHELLRMKRAGEPNASIAAHTGLHEGSVRRILSELFDRLNRVKADDPVNVKVSL